MFLIDHLGTNEDSEVWDDTIVINCTMAVKMEGFMEDIITNE
jgi:hypothetical protein